MADQNLPEGTDTIINDSELATATGTNASDSRSTLTNNDSSDAVEDETGRSGGMKDSLRNSSSKLRSTANDRAMGFVSQGIERSSGALTNVSALIGDTAASIDERLGAQYGDYARSAAEAIERAATSLSTKEPEELFEDARALVRKSPTVALAGAAILGFALVRVVKSGLDNNERSGRKR